VGAAVGVACYAVYLLSMVLLQPVAAGLLTSRARDALLAPDEPPRPRPALAEVVACLRGATPVTLVVVTGVLGVIAATWMPIVWAAKQAGLFADEMTEFTSVERTLYIFLEFPGILLAALLMGRLLVFPSVVTMEGLGGLAALRRSFGLARPFVGLSAWIVGLHLIVHAVSGWVVRLSLGQLARVPFGRMLDSTADSVVHDAALLLIAITLVVSWTFTFTMASVMYLAGRQAEGVTLEAIGGPTAPEPPAP
jgi:hypothetical protein